MIDLDRSEAARERLIAYNCDCYVRSLCSLSDLEHALDIILRGEPAPNGGWWNPKQTASFA